MNHSDALYRINDVLSSLMCELGVELDDMDMEDEILNELTHTVANMFGLEDKHDR